MEIASRASKGRIAPERRPRWIVGVEAVSVLAFVGLWGWLAAGAVGAVDLPRLAWLVPLAAVLGFLAADFVSGCVHWLADRYFDPGTPLLGPLLVAPFREHHRDPEDITRHGFLELLGNNALATLPMGLALVAWVRPEQGLRSQLLQAGVCSLALALFFTNAFHRWAHSASPPRVIGWLQRRGLVLSPEKHALHHAGAHDRSYCVTSGWLNPLLDRLGFFSRAENGIEAARVRLRRSSAAAR